MSTNVGKKNIAHKGSGHGVVGPPAMSLVTPPAPPAPTPFVYSARASNAKKTKKKYIVAGSEVLVKGSTMSLDPPANQPAQSGGGDVVTHATKNVAVMTMGSTSLVVAGKDVCATGDIAALNVITAESSMAQVQMPLLEAGDFEAARKAAAAAAAEMMKKWRAFPPPKAKQCQGGHPVDLGTGYVVDDAVDLELPGFIPLVWSRSYSSAARSHRGALGAGGWTHSFEQWVEETEAGYRFHNEEGLPVDFGPTDENGTSFHRGERIELQKRGRSFEIRSLRDRRIRTFSALPNGRHALRSIRDSRFHEIQLVYEGNLLVRIVDSVKREIRIANDKKGRVTRVEVWAREPGSGRVPTLQTWFDYGYHQEGELASHTNALGYAERWEYDGLRRMVKVTLRNGVSFHYKYHDELGYCVHTWGDGGLHDVRIEIDFVKGETCTHGTNRARRYYWKNGIVYREETYGGEWATERIYDDDEILIAVKNGAGEGTTYEHDGRGNLIQETDPAGNVSRWEYQDDLPTRYVGPSGLETRYAHDHHGSLIGISFPTGLSYGFELDREGRVRTIHGREGARAALGYDEHSNICTEMSGRGATTSYRHDALGLPVEQVDAIGRKSRVQYDMLGQALQIVRSDGTRVGATYDPLGKLSSATDALGHVTRLDHAGTGHLARIVQADGQICRFLYDSDERLIRILNPRLEKNDFEYDHADRIVAERTFDDRLITYRYNRAGRVVRVDHPEGEWRELRHDKLGNVLEDRGSDVHITFERDMLGRVEKAICQDATGKVVTEFERDRFGRLAADIQNGRAVRYEYDKRGRRSARVLPDGERTEYHYDFDDAFAGVTHEGNQISIERDALGRERTRQAKGWRLDCDYDRMDRLLSQKVIASEPVAGAVKIVAERRYGYDAKGRLTSIAGLHGGLTTYNYDSIDQLIEARRGSALEVFEYDPTGSITNVLSGFAEGSRRPPWSFTAGNQLRATDRAMYVNDGRGRRIQRIERRDGNDLRTSSPRCDQRVTTYGWDTKDRLREVVLPDGTRVRFTYDAFGRRVGKDVVQARSPLSSVLSDISARTKGVKRRTVEFLWDGDVLCEEVDSTNDERAHRRIHVHEPGTFLPMLQIEQALVFGVINDHLGIPKELIDNDGRVTWRAQHGACGNVTEVVRDNQAIAAKSPFRMLGQYLDEETGLCYTRFRYFEAETGRWLSSDPLGVDGGKNLYAFNGSVTSDLDPLGLSCKVNVDASSARALVSCHPDRDKVLALIQGKKLVMTETAAEEFYRAAMKYGGPVEKARALALLLDAEIVADNPSPSFMALKETKSVGYNDKLVFGTGDRLGIPTITSDRKFSRGASSQGVTPNVIEHESISFVGK
ncbi:DUF6531 domain-containing protein [Sorangium sp. So ce1151]|uniref:DUF6531 domain-containing protein n=1 Tax=Sorangium sp. So ce1151 TaxID=3133332 RepID=UPI003F637F64